MITLSLCYLSAANTSDGPSPEKDFGRRRPPRSKVGGPGARNSEDSNNDNGPRSKRRTSLRIGNTGRKARGAQITQRRGSLKKRDRRAEKERKAEAAVERNTVDLPEGRSLTVSELAEIIDEKPIGVIKFLMTDLGVMASMTQSLDPATCVAVVEGFGKFVGGADDMEEDESL